MAELLTEHWPMALLISAIVAAIVVTRFSLRDEKYPYEKRRSLLTKSQLTFYRVLKDAVDGRWSVHPMVRLADLVQVRPQARRYQAWQNRIHARHVDFLLCDQNSLEAKLAVKLDEPLRRPGRQQQDQFLAKALGDAGIPLLRIDVESDYNANSIRQFLHDNLSKKG
ncbi:MAG: DUF2726 domain-containing protein [Planctomycetes bacterium]|nr:DUF2726 domain-containing protein [Planctomycetota bacterium]